MKRIINPKLNKNKKQDNTVTIKSITNRSKISTVSQPANEGIMLPPNHCNYLFKSNKQKFSRFTNKKMRNKVERIYNNFANCTYSDKYWLTPTFSVGFWQRSQIYTNI